MGKIRLLVAEDDCIIRMGIVKLLESYPEYCVIGESQDGPELVEKYFKIKPDIVLCDLSMPVMNGLESSVKILEQEKCAKIILFTGHNEEENIYAAIRIGVLGYISKSVEIADLRSAIESVHAGGTYYPAKTEGEIEDIKLKCIKNKKQRKLNEFTDREKEVLKLLSRGMKSIEIANELELSKRTVDCYRRDIMSKINLKSAAQLIKYAIEFYTVQNGSALIVSLLAGIS